MGEAIDEEVGAEGFEEGDVHGGGVLAGGVEQEEEESNGHGDEDLEEEFAAGGEAEVAHFSELGVVVVEADGAEAEEA